MCMRAIIDVCMFCVIMCVYVYVVYIYKYIYIYICIYIYMCARVCVRVDKKHQPQSSRTCSLHNIALQTKDSASICTKCITLRRRFQ